MHEVDEKLWQLMHFKIAKSLFNSHIYNSSVFANSVKYFKIKANVKKFAFTIHLQSMMEFLLLWFN